MPKSDMSRHNLWKFQFLTMKKLLLVFLIFPIGFLLNAQNYKSKVNLKYVLANPVLTKTVTIRLNGIFMGECGNGKNCTHEPVAGWVTASLNKLSDQGQYISPYLNVEQALNSSIWKNGRYALVCTNDMARWQPDPTRGEGLGTGAAMPLANNVWRTLTFQIPAEDWANNQIQFSFNCSLGCQHKDNDFASTGEHWIDEMGESKKIHGPWVNGRLGLFTFGPYQTTSDRCHQFWLQFEVTSN
jgi:hypothetical protein